MNDYKKLIENVRICDSGDCCGCTLHGNKINCQEVLLESAADAIEQLVKIARQLCEGFLDMPSGCDGCPLVDTQILDEEGNGICALYRRANDE